MKTRRRFTGEFKAKVALEALQGQRTIAELATRHELHPNVITQWRRQAIGKLASRMPGSDAKGVGLFGRVMGAPPDQNLVDSLADGGVNFSGIVPHRPDDSLAIGFAYVGISNRVHGFDLDSGLPVARNFESLLETCYTM